MSRGQNSIEAYLDTLTQIRIYLSTSYYNGISDTFWLRMDQALLPLRIITKYNYGERVICYECELDDDFDFCSAAQVVDAYGRSIYLQYGLVSKTEAFQAQFACPEENLGCFYQPGSTTFRVWSPLARQIWLEMEGQLTPMLRLKKGIHALELEGDYLGQEYAYVVEMSGQLTRISDPYAFDSRHNGEVSVVCAIQDRESYHPVCQYPIIYETSIRDLTIGLSCPDRGTMKAAGQEGLAYLAKLGVNCIQWMPVLDFGSVDENHTTTFYNWGYDPVSFRSLEGWLCADDRHRVKELTDLVKVYHQAGMSVVLDVVFNHVFDIQRFGLNVLMPNYYFQIGDHGQLSNGTWCGNDFDSTMPMAKSFLIDSLVGLVKLYDVDGFRFDLMGILSIDCMQAIEQALRAIKPGILLYGEGWNMASYLAENKRASIQNGQALPGYAFFDDNFRNVIRGVNDPLEQGGYGSGRLELIAQAKQVMVGQHPTLSFKQCIHYVSCHDNHTLWDKNRVACAHLTKEQRQRLQLINIGLTLLSRGIPFIHGGIEFCRTKNGIGNSYRSPDVINQYDYNRMDQMKWLIEQTKRLIQLRHQWAEAFDQPDACTAFEIGQGILGLYLQRGKRRLMAFFNPSEQQMDYWLDEPGQVVYSSTPTTKQVVQRIDIQAFSLNVVTNLTENK